MTPSMRFAPGELVRPKRGGPPMRVDHYGDFDLVHCTWLDEKHSPQSKPFPENWLENIPSNQTAPDSWSSPDNSSA
jgi:uncharacterized protein YodC (DUF2158 family)